MAGKSRSAQFYAKNPEARKKKYACLLYTSDAADE